MTQIKSPHRPVTVRARAAVVAAVTLLGGGIAVATLPSSAPAAEQGSPAQIGAFATPVSEPTVGGKTTKENCVDDPNRAGHLACKPAAVSTNILPSGKVLYFNGLEGLEEFVSLGATNAIPSGGTDVPNDQSRLLTLDAPGKMSWTNPLHVDSGANPDGDPWFNPLLPGLATQEKFNDGALFCSDSNIMADGRVIDAGGSAYYSEPGIANPALPGGGLGVIELQGLHATRVYDPTLNDWVQVGDMARGRWYPTMVELPDGKEFIAGGVGKLIKPVYPDHPEESLTNTLMTETFDPHTGRWTQNPKSADKSLPLYPRLHLLPNGHIFYNAEGQSFNPVGQGYDEALWIIASSYDPKAQKWNDLGIAGGGLKPLLGFRGSTFSLMLPLKPNADGAYTKASIISAGGIIGNPNPGTYLPVKDTTITTVDTAGGKEKATTVSSGDLNQPRWYSTGVLLPNGQVMAFSGADRDEVVVPGLEKAIRQAELWDPATGKWTPMATQNRERTYHNTAALLPDGRVLVGGHSPISTAYASGDLSGLLGTAPRPRDPTFEIYSPPYMHWGARPSIKSAPANVGYGSTFNVATGGPASNVDSVVLVRNSSITHLIDGDQRNVELPIVSRSGNRLTVKSPPGGEVAPPGAYMLFINQKTDKGIVPSVSRTLWVSKQADPTLKLRSVKLKGRTITVKGSLDRKTALQPLLTFRSRAGKVVKTTLKTAKRDNATGTFVATLVGSRSALRRGGTVSARYPGEGFFRSQTVKRTLKSAR